MVKDLKEYSCPVCGRWMATLKDIDGELHMPGSSSFYGIDEPCRECRDDEAEDREQ